MILTAVYYTGKKCRFRITNQKAGAYYTKFWQERKLTPRIILPSVPLSMFQLPRSAISPLSYLKPTIPAISHMLTHVTHLTP